MPESLGTLDLSNPILVVDSWPVMEWLKNRLPIAATFTSLIESARLERQILLMSSINVGEIYYSCWNEWGELRAKEVLAIIRMLPISIVHPTEEDSLTAARIKGRSKISYADAFAAVLAIPYRSAVLRGDSDFLKLRDPGLITVGWLGK